VSVEQQLSTLPRWLTALTVVTVVLAIAVFVLSSTRFEHIRAHRIEVAPPNKPALIVFSTNRSETQSFSSTTKKAGSGSASPLTKTETQ
jgi:predicted lactoylglutathione lyase